MNVAGIDVSSRAVDIVAVPLDPDIIAAPAWEHHEFVGANAIERATIAPDVIPRGTFWDNVAEVAIERPYGPGGDTLFALHLMVGAVAAALPARLRPPLFLHPSQWRKAAGISGRASKEDVARYAVSHSGLLTDAWTQDACDAYCIAIAARNLNLERLERAA